MPGGYRCGYVGLPKGNKFYGKSCEKIPVVCHGGITYAQKYLVGQDDKDTYWIGFDCAHFRDEGEMRNWRVKCILKTWK